MPGIVEESWIRIERWLGTHAPASLSTLNPPASKEAIGHLHRALGFDLPGQLVAVLRRHNGSGVDWNTAQLMLSGGYGLMSAALIEQIWRTTTEILESSENKGPLDGYWWHRQWIPFAVSPSTDTLVVDQRPGIEQGRIGDHMKEQTYFESWASLAEMYADIADGLEQRREVDGCLAEVNDGVLSWREPHPGRLA
jgi:cell wall assembly regulator SMI1